MSADQQQTFVAGPRAMNPAFGIAIVVACLALAVAQIWAVAGHILGTRSLAAYEPAARGLFALVFIAAAFGVLVAVLEYRNGRVTLDEDGLTVCCWVGCRSRARWDAVDAVGYIETDEDETDFAFHWLYVATRDGRSIRLAGGPWPPPQSVQLLRHELIDRLDLQQHETEQIRWALLFPAVRTRWS